MQSKWFRVCFTAIIACLLVKPASASVAFFQDGRIFDHYATESIEAAAGTNEQAILDIERQAQSDPSREARAYVFLAKALVERMHFRPDSANHFAVQCMNAAKGAANDTAFALCGWLRMNLAASEGDYERMALISGQIEAANHRIMRIAGLTDRDVEGDPYFSFLRSPSSYADVRSWGRPSVHTSLIGADNVPLTYDAVGRPRVKVRINGRTAEFMLDTGTGPTIVSRSLAAKLNLDISHYQVGGYDIQGRRDISSVAFIKSFSVGAFTVNNFSVLVEKLGKAPPILGMDFLRQVGRFTIRHNKLTLNPKVDLRCHTPAILSSAIFPDYPLIGIETQSNFGRIYAGLDTGAYHESFASALWGMRKKFGFEHAGATTFHLQSIVSESGPGLTFYVPQVINLRVSGIEFKRTLYLYTNLSLDFDLMLNNKSTRDFSYYFDLVNGVACMRPIRGPAS